MVATDNPGVGGTAEKLLKKRGGASLIYALAAVKAASGRTGAVQ
jgi:hypothetical protein